jgi:hypothetical protein
MVEERPWIVRRICRFSAGRLKVLLRSLAGHFYVAAQGQQGDFVIGFAVLEAEEARPKAHGKRLDADAEELGDDKVAKLMDHHHEADKDDEGNDSDNYCVNILHRLAIFPR